MDDKNLEPETRRILKVFDLTEQYSAFIDDLMEKHKGQSIPILLMMAVNICLMLETEAEKEGRPLPEIPAEQRQRLNQIARTIVNQGPIYTGKFLTSMVLWTSEEASLAATIVQAERIAKDAEG